MNVKRTVRTGTIIIITLFFFWYLLPAVADHLFNPGSLLGIAGCIIVNGIVIFWKRIKTMLTGIYSHLAGKIILVLAGILIAAGIILTLMAIIKIQSAAHSTIPDGGTTAIVLGCSVHGERPSLMLSERIQKAYDYLNRYPDTLAILSGGKGTGESISEAECMYRELVKKGIDSSRLYKEDASTDTRENMEYSATLMAGLGLDSEAVVITNEFHEYRAGIHAAQAGIHSYSYPAHTSIKYLPIFYTREVVGVVYTWLFRC